MQVFNVIKEMYPIICKMPSFITLLCHVKDCTLHCVVYYILMYWMQMSVGMLSKKKTKTCEVDLYCAMLSVFLGLKCNFDETK